MTRHDWALVGLVVALAVLAVLTGEVLAASVAFILGMISGAVYEWLRIRGAR